MQKTLIDHIITNILEKLIHQNVVLADEIGDHDLPYVILNIRKQKFEKRYKYIHHEKRFDLSKYHKNFSQIPMSVVDAFDDPNDQTYMLNELTLRCVNHHALLRQVKLTHPPAPWIADLNNQAFQQKKEKKEKRKTIRSDKKLYKDTKKQMKAEIKGKKGILLKSFIIQKFKRVLGHNSSNFKA